MAHIHGHSKQNHMALIGAPKFAPATIVQGFISSKRVIARFATRFMKLVIGLGTPYGPRLMSCRSLVGIGYLPQSNCCQRISPTTTHLLQERRLNLFTPAFTCMAMEISCRDTWQDV